MGTYIYGLTKRTKTDPVYGKVYILKFLHKPWGWNAPEKYLRAEERREQAYHNKWAGQTIPKYVCFDNTKRDTNGRLTDVMEYTGGAVWCDEYEKFVTYVRENGRDVTPPPTETHGKLR